MIKQESCGTIETNKGKDYKDTFQYCFVSILWEKALTTKTLKTDKKKRGNTSRCKIFTNEKKWKNKQTKYRTFAARDTRRHKLSTNKKMK